MTAREVADLARVLIKDHAEFYPRFSQKEFQYRRFKFRNRNALLFQDIGVDGLKTGSLKEVGCNLVASAVQNGKRLIAVVMGLPDCAPVRVRDAQAARMGLPRFRTRQAV